MSDQKSLNQEWITAMREGDCSSNEIGKLATEIGRHTGYFQMGEKIYNMVVENPSDSLRDQIISKAAKILGKDEEGNYSFQPVAEGFGSAVQRYMAQCIAEGAIPANHEAIFIGLPTNDGSDYGADIRAHIESAIQERQSQQKLSL